MRHAIAFGLALTLLVFLVHCRAPEPEPPQESNDLGPPVKDDVNVPEAVQETAPPSPDRETPWEPVLRDERPFGDVTVRLLGPENMRWETTVQIVRDGKVVYSKSEESAVEFPSEGNPVQDFTHNGRPDLLLECYSGGAHCCFTYIILSLGAEIAEVARLETGNSGLILRDVDNDGVSAFFTGDDIWAYWGTDFADSAQVSVVLVFGDGHIVLDDAVMRKPPPTDEDWQNRLDTIKDAWEDEKMLNTLKSFQKDWDCPPVPPLLWQNMLDFIYSGNGDAAWRFLDQAWPKDRPGEDNFRKAFEQQLAKSPYKKQIDKLNGW